MGKTLKRLPADAFEYCPMGGKCSMKCRWSKPKPVQGGWADPPHCFFIETLLRIDTKLANLDYLLPVGKDID